MERKESDFWWMIKGICIIAVVFIHSLIQNGLSMELVIVRQFINFPVYVFVFMVGYFVNQSKVLADWKRWMGKRFVRLAVPYIIVSFLYLVYSYYIKDIYINIKGVIASCVLGTSNVQMYYLSVIMQLTILTPVLIKWKNKTWFKTLCLGVSGGCILLNYFPNRPVILGSFCGAWLFFYFVGLQTSDNIAGKSSWKNWLWATVVSFGIMCAESVVLYNTAELSGNSITQLKLSNALFCYCLVRFLLLCPRISLENNNILCVLGKFSFSIYLMHMFIVDSIFLVAPNMSAIFVFILTMVISVLIAFFFERINGFGQRVRENGK